MLRLTTFALVCAFPLAFAHLPIFPDTDEPYDADGWDTQSVALYVEDTQTFTVTLPDINVDDKLEFSLSVPSYQALPTELNVTITGGARTPCDSDWTGWQMEDHASRRLHTADTADGALYTPPAEKKYEAFGVGFYTPVRACKARFTAAAVKVSIVISASSKFDFTVGLGMRENMVNFFTPELQISLYRVWEWFGREPWEILLAPLLWIGIATIWFWYQTRKTMRANPGGRAFGTMSLGMWMLDVLLWPVGMVFTLFGWMFQLCTAKVFLEWRKEKCRKWREHETRREFELAAMLLMASPLAFIVAIAWAQHEDEWDDNMWISIVLHVALPVLASLWLLARKSSTEEAGLWGGWKRMKVAAQAKAARGRIVLDVAAIFWLLAYTWQSYFVGDVVLLHATFVELYKWFDAPTTYQLVQAGGVEKMAADNRKVEVRRIDALMKKMEAQMEALKAQKKQLEQAGGGGTGRTFGRQLSMRALTSMI